LAILTAIVFGVSAVFPLVAAFVKDREAWPAWWGVVDVALAFVLASLAFVVIGLAQGKVTKDADGATYRAYRLMIHGILVVLALFILAGERIVWGNCLTGIAWRVWLLLYGLPSWFTLMRQRSGAGAGRN
jgi:hypothetical protein